MISPIWKPSANVSSTTQSPSKGTQRIRWKLARCSTLTLASKDTAIENISKSKEWMKHSNLSRKGKNKDFSLPKRWLWRFANSISLKNILFQDIPELHRYVPFRPLPAVITQNLPDMSFLIGQKMLGNFVKWTFILRAFHYATGTRICRAGNEEGYSIHQQQTWEDTPRRVCGFGSLLFRKHLEINFLIWLYNFFLFIERMASDFSDPSLILGLCASVCRRKRTNFSTSDEHRSQRLRLPRSYCSVCQQIGVLPEPILLSDGQYPAVHSVHRRTYGGSSLSMLFPFHNRYDRKNILCFLHLSPYWMMVPFLSFLPPDYRGVIVQSLIEENPSHRRIPSIKVGFKS